MTANSLFFLFVFLPLSLILYHLVPRRMLRARQILLVVLSLVFFTWSNPLYLPLLLLSLAFNYFSALEISACKKTGRGTGAKAAMITAVAGNVLMLVFFKYLPFLVSNLNLIPGLSLPTPDLALPIGLSFYTFTVLSYVLDVYMDRAEAQTGVLGFLVYATFFPKLSSGPIIRYKDMIGQIEAPAALTPARFGAGLNMMLVGLFKKVLIADNLATVMTAIQALDQRSVATAWLGLVIYGFNLYFDFSGYSDMAIGMGRMFGFDLGINFDHPYTSRSISEFWRRWHITLGAWFREYVYIPLGGNRVSSGRLVLNLLIVWTLTGLWHGASWTFILWGLWHGLFIVLERMVFRNRFDKLPGIGRTLVTYLVVTFAWAMFFSPNPGAMVSYYGQLFGIGASGVIDPAFRYFLGSSLILLVVSVIGSGPWVQRLHQRLTYWRGGNLIYVSAALYIVLLVLSVAGMVSDTYSAFLYFQF